MEPPQAEESLGEVQKQSIPEHRYSYSPLSAADHTRFLLLKPFNEGDLFPEADLVEMSVSDAKSLGYEALSYTWGPPTFTEKLLVQDAYLLITTSLASALKLLGSDGPRPLWVDAVCIDQENPKEKAVQIPLMTDIYSSAKQVPIWLGEGTEHTDTAFSCIIPFANELTAILNDRDTSPTAQTIRFQNLIDEREAECLALTNLFEQSWFERIWVVQEFFLSKSSLFLWGNSELTSQSLVAFCDRAILSRVADHTMKSPRALRNAMLFNNLSREKDTSWGNVLYGHKTPSQRPTLLKMLSGVKERQCCDSRDRLYALGGICADPDMLPYKADYEKSPPTVYSDFAMHYIQHRGIYDLIPTCSVSPRRMPGLPSWVPDFVWTPRSTFSSWGVYSASGLNCRRHQEARTRTISGQPCLFLKGRIVDELKYVWLPDWKMDRLLRGPHDNEDRIYRHERYLTMILDQLVTFCQANSIPWRVLWRLLLAGRSISQLARSNKRSLLVDADEEWVIAGIIACMAVWNRDRVLQETGLVADSDNTSGASASSSDTKDRNQDLQYVEHFVMRLHAWAARSGAKFQLLGRLSEVESVESHQAHVHMISFLGLTIPGNGLGMTRGGDIGWVPEESKDDLVAIIAGHDAPVVLRRVKDGLEPEAGVPAYQFVGEAFVLGMMGGEAVKDGTPEGSIFEDICLV
jgi:hypothetical protein